MLGGPGPQWESHWPSSFRLISTWVEESLPIFPRTGSRTQWGSTSCDSGHVLPVPTPGARGIGSFILPLPRVSPFASSEHTANSFLGKPDWIVHWLSIYFKYLYKYLLKSCYAPGTMLAPENTTVCSCHSKVNHLSQSVFMNFFQGSITSLRDYSRVLQMASAGSWLCPHRPLQLLNSLSMSSPFKRQKYVLSSISTR